MDIDEAQEGIKMAFTHFLDNRKSALQQMHENALDYWKPLYDALHFERIYTSKIFVLIKLKNPHGTHGRCVSLAAVAVRRAITLILRFGLGYNESIQ